MRLEGLGYRAEAVPTPNVKPSDRQGYATTVSASTYFTVGNLVQYCISRRADPKQESSTVVFFTAGACAPAVSAC